MHEINTSPYLYKSLIQMQSQYPQHTEEYRVVRSLAADMERGGIQSPDAGVKARALLALADQHGAAFVAEAMRPGNRGAEHLARMLAARANHAAMLNEKSYAHLQFATTSAAAGTPEAAEALAVRVATAVAPHAAHAVASLTSQSSLTAHEARRLMYDRDHQARRVRDAALACFPLPRVLERAAELLSRLFGVRVVSRCANPDEAWVPGMRAFDVFDATEQEDGKHHSLLATILLDLATRPDKPPQDAHFTLRCAHRRDEGGARVPALVALVCTMAADDRHLSPRDVTLLLHELGHAMHSALSNTRFQHSSGTRTAMDVAEIPSHFLERFASNASVMRFLSADTLGESSAAELVAPSPHSAAFELASSAFWALADLRLHGVNKPVDDVDRVLQEVQEELHDVAYAHLPARPIWISPGERPALRFVHLYGYGAGYYSYLYARAVASSVYMHSVTENMEIEAVLRGGGGHNDNAPLASFADAALKVGGSLKGADYVVGLADLAGGLDRLGEYDPNGDTTGFVPHVESLFCDIV